VFGVAALSVHALTSCNTFLLCFFIKSTMGAQHARRVRPEPDTGAVAPTSDAAVLKDVETGLSSQEPAPPAAAQDDAAAAAQDDAPAAPAAPETGGTTRDVAALRKLYANPMYRAPNPSFEQRNAAQSRWRRRPVKTEQQDGSV
jgi:hypothetical protein